VEPVLIDIANPKAIREKLPEIRALFDAKQNEARRVSTELEGLRQLINYVVAIAGGPGDSHSPEPSAPKIDKTKRRVSAKQKAIEALRRAGRPIGPAELYRFMEAEGMPLPPTPNALGASLYAAAKEGREVIKTDEGYMARPITDYARAAELGFPVPSPADGTPDGDGARQHKLSPIGGASQE